MIHPVHFARAIQQAIIYRSAGMSQAEAVVQSCRYIDIPDIWAPIIHFTLDASQSLAEDWCERVINDALDHAHSNEGAFRG
jgi:hypothetical protein